MYITKGGDFIKKKTGFAMLIFSILGIIVNSLFIYRLGVIYDEFNVTSGTNILNYFDFVSLLIFVILSILSIINIIKSSK